MREDTNIKAADSELDLWLVYLLCGLGKRFIFGLVSQRYGQCHAGLR